MGMRSQPRSRLNHPKKGTSPTKCRGYQWYQWILLQESSHQTIVFALNLDVIFPRLSLQLILGRSKNQQWNVAPPRDLKIINSVNWSWSMLYPSMYIYISNSENLCETSKNSLNASSKWYMYGIVYRPRCRQGCRVEHVNKNYMQKKVSLDISILWVVSRIYLHCWFCPARVRMMYKTIH